MVMLIWPCRAGLCIKMAIFNDFEFSLFVYCLMYRFFSNCLAGNCGVDFFLFMNKYLTLSNVLIVVT